MASQAALKVRKGGNSVKLLPAAVSLSNVWELFVGFSRDNTSAPRFS